MINFHKPFLICGLVLLVTWTDFAQTIEELEVQLDSLETKAEKIRVQIEEVKLGNIIKDLKEAGYPLSDIEVQVIEHKAMVLGYAEKHEQAAWVAHIILPDIEKGNVSRTNDFRQDKLVTTGSAGKSDYWYSGYDRGHLAPSADFKWSHTALSETYFYSNMSPQRPELNRETWAELEALIRDYVVNNHEQLYIVTGGVLTEDLPKIQKEDAKNEVSIPNIFYKVILDYTGDEKQGIAFLMPNGECSEPLLTYAVTIDSVEALTGINFFPNLSIDELEQVINLSVWKTEEMQGEVLPLSPSMLKKGQINTSAAKYNIGEKSCVCGTVVSTKYSEKSGATFLNLDKKFPNQVFSVTIWKDDRTNFSYSPEEELKDKKVCISGLIKESKGTPTINVSKEEQIQLLD
ncbi:DNA/RNA non-specific endonuclease [Parvicella tangerina]|uniref:DNA/RNA non-specific endonuclease n=1 Tax=Parvicella tangerina TaxID=2829795 RepID=A0A916JLD8_9FLAO|nr:DNA/RNA non-specific endonuclease [Parvicella tangerina]CAG5080704.1 hypothetical protein CRYO30217_01423 [Parvicella tangerina]